MNILGELNEERARWVLAAEFTLCVLDPVETKSIKEERERGGPLWCSNKAINQNSKYLKFNHYMTHK